MNSTASSFSIFPIGYIKRNDERVWIEVKEKFIPGIKEIEHFSHIHVIWWLHKSDTKEYRSSFKYLQVKGEYTEETPVMGIFATRMPIRPNPIAISVAKIIEVDAEKGIIVLQDLDAINNTPILDLKPYHNLLDRVKDATLPKYMDFYENIEWFPEDGLQLEESTKDKTVEGRYNP